MTPVNRVLVVIAAAGCMFADAHAQSAGAEALFREGRKLIKQGKVEAGCNKLEASDKLESSVGTLLNLGDCREKLGKHASAWAAFRKAEAMAKRAGNDKKRQAEARRRATALEGALANITIQVGSKSRSEGLIVKRDGEVLDPDVWGTAVPVDPGAHTIIAEAPGKKPWKTEISVGKGGKRWVVVPTLESVPEPARPAPPPAVAVTPSPAPAAETVVETPATRTITITPTWSTTRQLGVGLGVAGAAAIGVGIYFGAKATDLESQANAICPNRECGDQQALELNDRAQVEAKRANILFVAGGAAVAAATVMWFVGRPEMETVIAPAISETHVGAALSRRF